MNIHPIMQTNPTECGVCVINTLFNFYHFKIDKSVILDRAKITDSGIDLLELENLALNFKLNCKSYKVSESDLNDIKINKPYITIFNDDLVMHYTIFVKLSNNSFQIHDSIKGTYELNKEKFLKNFSYILIDVDPIKVYSKLEFDKNSFKINLNWAFVSLIILLHLGIFIISIFASYFFSNTFLNNLQTYNVLKTISIVIILIILNITELLLTSLVNLIAIKQIKILNKLIKNQIFSSLRNKTSEFYVKIDCNKFYLLNRIPIIIANFYWRNIPSFICNFITFLISSGWAILINNWSILIVFLIVLIELLFYYFFRQNERELIESNTNNEAIFYGDIKNLIIGKNDIFLKDKILNISNVLDRNINNEIVFESKSINYDIVYQIANILISNLLILIVAISMIKNNLINLGKLIFLINLISHIFNDAHSLIGFLNTKFQTKYFNEILSEFIFVENYRFAKTSIQIKKIERIYFENENNNKITIKNCQDINKKVWFNELNALTFNENLKNQKIKINNIWFNNLNNEYFKSQIILINESSICSIKNLNFNENSNLQAEILKFFNINISSNNLTTKQNKIVTLLYLTTLKNKIIILDNFFESFNSKDTKYIKNILKQLSKMNFFIFLNNH